VHSADVKPLLARCPLGGPAPCVDDLCHGGDHTLCGLELGFDFCEHGFIPETCPDCLRDWNDEPEDWDDDYQDAARG